MLTTTNTSYTKDTDRTELQSSLMHLLITSNRTASNVRSAFHKGKRKYRNTVDVFLSCLIRKDRSLSIKKNVILDADDLMMQALDAGAEDFSEEEDSFEILTDPNDFSEVRLALEEAGIPMASAEVTMIPQTMW